MKVAMIANAVQRYNRDTRSKHGRIQHRLIHTGQHYEHKMSGVFFEELNLPEPHYHLGVGSGSHGKQTGQMLEKIEAVLLAEKPDVVMVYGDTNSTLAGAIAATKLHIPVAHLESGLRSFNRKMPEEINRVASDHISDFLFCPTETAVDNLRKEGIQRNVFLTGDVMLDSVVAYRAKARKRTQLLQDLGVTPQEYALATIHRAENTNSPAKLGALLKALASVQQTVILPMHPRVREMLKHARELRRLAKTLRNAKNLKVIAPVSYLDMLALELHARVVLTDSGGVQKEAFFSGVPCLTLRDETEWIETLEGGWNRVVGTDPATIRAAFQKEWAKNRVGRGETPDWKAFGDSRSGDETIKVLVRAIHSTRHR